MTTKNEGVAGQAHNPARQAKKQAMTELGVTGKGFNRIIKKARRLSKG